MKYQHIMEDLIQQIQDGKLRPKDKLPSIRQLSQSYSCTKETVQKALTELKYQHYIYPIAKSGYYVLSGMTEQTNAMDLPLSDQEHTAYEDFRVCLNESLVGHEHQLFNYSRQHQGLEDVLLAVQEQLVATDVYCKPEHIVLTAGTQQALYILSQIAFPNQTDHILIEQPTYDRMNDLVSHLQLPYLTIERSLNGIDLAELERLFQTELIKYFYTIPRLHMPLGHSYSLKEKKAIVELAQTYDVYIIEDDYMADLVPKQTPPLHYYDTHHRVIYLKSFSTSIFPALRISAVVLPKHLLAAFLEYKKLMDYDANLILQQALALYLRNGLFEKNKQLLRRTFYEQESQIKQALAAIPFTNPFLVTGRGVTIELPAKSQIAPIQHSGLPIQLLDAHYLTRNPHRYIFLPYSPTFSEHLISLAHYLSEK